MLANKRLFKGNKFLEMMELKMVEFKLKFPEAKAKCKDCTHTFKYKTILFNERNFRKHCFAYVLI